MPATFVTKPTPAAAATPEVTAYVGATRLTYARKITYEAKFNDVGSFSFEIPVSSSTSTERGYLTYGTVVTFKEFGTTSFVGIVESLEQTTVARGEEHDQYLTVAGRSVLAELERGVVYPSTGIHEVPSGPLAGLLLGVKPFCDTRYWNWASINLDRSSWGSPTSAVTVDQMPPLFPPSGYAGGPEAWPWQDGDWVVPTAASGGYHSARTWYLYTTFTSSGVFSVDILASAGVNDSFQLWVDGMPTIVAEAKDGQKTHRVNIGVNDGTHYLCARITHGGGNTSGNITGFCCGVSKHYDDGSGYLEAPLALTGSGTWKCLDNPSTPPGFTATEIAADLVNEAQARDCFDGWTLDFTSTATSDSEAPQDVIEFNASVGTKVIDALKSLAEDYGEFDYDLTATNGRKLMWSNRDGDPIPGGGTSSGGGSATAVELEAGSNILELTHHNTSPVATALLSRWNDGYFEVPETSAITTYGRWEAFYSIPERFDGSSAAYTTGLQAQTQSTPLVSIDNLRHRMTADTQYAVRDTVTAPLLTAATWRVMGRAVETDDDGNGFVSSSLGVARDIQLERLDRWQRKLQGTLDGRSETASVSSPSIINSETISATTYSFSTGGSGVTLVGDRGTPQRPDGPVILTKVEIETDIAGTSGSTTARVEVNGTSIGTATLTSGADTGYSNLSTRVRVDRSDWVNIETTAAGGAQGITVRVLGCPAT